MSLNLATSRFAVYLAVGFAWKPNLCENSNVEAEITSTPAPRVLNVQPVSVAVTKPAVALPPATESPGVFPDTSCGQILDLWA